MITKCKDIFEEVGALNKGHYVLKSGKHSEYYFNKDAVYAYPLYMTRIASNMMEPFEGIEIDCVVGPALGGIILAQYCGLMLNDIPQKDVKASFMEKFGNDFNMTRGNGKHVEGKRVLVVEDVITTGKSVCIATDVLHQSWGATIVGVAAMLNRSGIPDEEMAKRIEVSKLHSLNSMNIETYYLDDCPLCQAGVPINTDLGYGGKKR